MKGYIYVSIFSNINSIRCTFISLFVIYKTDSLLVALRPHVKLDQPSVLKQNSSLLLHSGI